MIGKYVYSLNGSEYTGHFETREAAESAALFAARRSEMLPEVIYVGRAVAPDTMASGHARAVIAHMTARAREQTADGSFEYLAELSKPQIDDLDKALETTVLGWLAKHELLPTFFRVESISEHPVPNPAEKRQATVEKEVYDLGVAANLNGN
jgi:hypothetical protein